jgi:hypothetical protein
VFDVQKLYKKENLKFHLQSISGKICLTSNMWLAINTNQYMVLTAHYINMRRELEKKVLAFFQFPPPHTGANLAEKILCLLKEWGIREKYYPLH